MTKLGSSNRSLDKSLKKQKRFGWQRFVMAAAGLLRWIIARVS
jgi:hypothetical protein